MSESWTREEAEATVYAVILLVGALTAAASSTHAQTWRPAQHIELVVPTSAGSGSDGHARQIERHLREKGLVRVLAVLAEQRLANTFPDVPTWAEFGVSGTAPNFRIVVGPRALTPEQIQYWDQVFGRLIKLDEWKRYLTVRMVEDVSADSRQTKDFIEKQYAELRAVLSELGLVKGKTSADTQGTIR